MKSGVWYGDDGKVVAGIQIYGSVDASSDFITVRPIQYLINGKWYSAEVEK